jgi:hypothetical protein
MGKWRYSFTVLELGSKCRWSGELHALATLTPEKQPSGTHWIGGRVGPKTGLDGVEKG